MTFSRRSLLQYAGAGCALALLPAASNATTTLRRYEVRDTVALPRFTIGDVVIADTAIGRFSGPGLYLYPAWGEPRLYEVHERDMKLEFRNPGSHGLLWTQSGGFGSSFAGKLVESAQAGSLAAGFPPLSVPGTPTTA